MAARAAGLLAAQPDLRRLLVGNARTGQATMTKDGINLSFATATSGPVWASLQTQWSRVADVDSGYTHLTFGTHARLGDSTLVGVMLQADRSRSEEGPGWVTGTGWLAGPYVVTTLGDGPLHLDGSLLWGRSTNEVSPLGTDVDRFSTERMLATFNLGGEVQAGRVTWTPGIGYAWTRDRQLAYVGGAGLTLPEQVTELGELSADLGWSLPLAGGASTLTGNLSAIWSEIDGGPAALGAPRARLDLGWRGELTPGLQLALDGWIDGLGTPDVRRQGVSLQLDWAF
jgi:hypothetical protein